MHRARDALAIHGRAVARSWAPLLFRYEAVEPVDAGGMAAADARLQRFLAAIADRLPRYLPD